MPLLSPACVCGWDKEIAVHHESSRLSFVEFGCEYFWLCRRRCGTGVGYALLPAAAAAAAAA